MAHKFDQIIVIDIEATCWNSPPPHGQENEIIEIGVCTLNIQSGERLTKESILVKPIRSTISPFCSQLTGITPIMIAEEGRSFEKACLRLRKDYFSKQRVWASYGDYDRRMFEKQCSTRQIPYPFGTTHLNIKSLFALMMGLPHEVGMKEALERLNLPLEGQHHRGHDDAWNTAQILAALLIPIRTMLQTQL